MGSSQTDPYLTTAAAAAALSGPLHGGANEEVLRMLDEIGSKDNVPAYVKKIKEGHGKLMGFGHRVYKNYDPRAKIIKWTADQVFEVTGRNPKLDIALELERIALEDEYFVKRKLYPNVDFYSGIIYQAMGFRPEMFTVLFAIPRTAGWLAQWQEMLTDPGAEDRASASAIRGTRGQAVRADGQADGDGNPRGTLIRWTAGCKESPAPCTPGWVNHRAGLKLRPRAAPAAEGLGCPGRGGRMCAAS